MRVEIFILKVSTYCFQKSNKLLLKKPTVFKIFFPLVWGTHSTTAISEVGTCLSVLCVRQI